MSFAALALVGAAAILGPLLALPRDWRLPVVLGELAGGIALGPTGADLLHARDGTFTFLADIGFALVMFVAGSHVPVRDVALRAASRTGALRALGVGVLSAALGVAACIVALPLAVDPAHAGRAALGALAVLASAALLLAILWYLERTGLRRRAHKVSEQRKFALELRVNLVLLFGLAALAAGTPNWAPHST